MKNAALVRAVFAMAAATVPAAAFAQNAASSVPAYARPSYTTPELVVHGRITAVSPGPQLQVVDERGTVYTVDVSPDVTRMLAMRYLQPGTPVAIRGVRDGDTIVATEIALAYAQSEPAPPRYAMQAPREFQHPTPPPQPVLQPPSRVLPPPDAVEPLPTPPEELQSEHAPVVRTAHVAAKKQRRQHPRVAHVPPRHVTARVEKPRPQIVHRAPMRPPEIATVRRAPSTHAPAPRPVRRVSTPLHVASPQEIQPTWYGWGKL